MDQVSSGEEGFKTKRISWYRSKVSRENMSRLNEKSDLKGFLQTSGYLGLLVLTASSACLSVGRLPWPVVIALFFFHGMCYHFLINGFHELVHDSVFKTRALNHFFLRIFSFLGFYNHVHFWASHTEHHKFTLHPPDDLEVVLPQKQTLKAFFKTGFVNPMQAFNQFRGALSIARGKIGGRWEESLFPESKPDLRRRYFNWARFLLVGHGLIFAVSMSLGLWYIPLVITFGRCYGGWLHILCNSSQHIGLRDNVDDFRLCCRTIYLNPFFRFLYWNMNYHTEHHMYAAVPCYNLGKLHALIREDLPRCPNGLYETWMQIADILKRQKTEPGYQFTAEVPARTSREEAQEISRTLEPTMS